MKTVLMAIAVVKKDDSILLRKTDPEKNPYDQPWALFGGRIEGEGAVQDSLNTELSARWNFTASITEKLWWDEDVKADHDGEVKRFLYVDALCEISEGIPAPVNTNEELAWVATNDLAGYDLNPPTKTLMEKLGYIGS